MAKGIEMNGMLRGKRGGVVYTRTGGEQVSRARNFSPSNPKTNGQLAQRAIMATVMQAYSAGKMIFNHSFENKQVPFGSMREFLRVNANALRAGFAADLDNGTTQYAFCGPKTKNCPPNLFIVSDGSLTQNFIVTGTQTVGSTVAKTGLLPEFTAGETIAEYLASYNVKAGDIFTFVVIQAYAKGDGHDVFQVVADDSDVATQTESFFGFLRLIVKPSAATSADEIDETTTWGDIFEVDDVLNIAFDADTTIVHNIISTSALPIPNNVNYAFGWIRSKLNSGERSKCVLEIPEWETNWARESGIASALTLAAWQQGSPQVGNSQLILEGAGF